MSNRSDLNLYIARLQQRLRLGAWLRGAAIFTGTALSLTIVLVFILSRFAFPAHGVTAARLAVFLGLAAAAAFGAALPLIHLTCQEAVRNAEFTKVLAKVMHRPAFFVAPAFALRMAMGEMADALLLEGQRTRSEAIADESYRRQERAFGRWARTVSLPGRVDNTRVTADLANGLLTVTLPKVEEPHPRQIAITATGM